MSLSSDQFAASIKARAILRFPDNLSLGTSAPHFFICICENPDNGMAFSCCTSQVNTVNALIAKHGWPESTFVYIPETDAENPFNKDTYINCNEYFTYFLPELWQWYLHGNLTLHGELPLQSFEQILNGFQESDQIEEVLKEKLPSIDDFP
jgi:hypothetical protein